jgi:hypothetical protein
MRSLLRIIVLSVLALPAWPAIAEAPQPSAAPAPIRTNVLFILDSSSSMWGQVKEVTKVSSARDILNNTLEDLPLDAQLGLVSFGHRRKKDCADIELVSPLGQDDAATLYRKAAGLKPRGTTPLSAALIQARDVFKDVQGAKMIVLITDGGEECGGDPCATAHELGKGGLVLRVNVVGFDLPEKERQELECVAREGAGRYFDVSDKQTLYKAITEIKTEIAEAAAAPPPPKPTPEPRPQPVVERPVINLLHASQGGRIVQQPRAGWDSIISGSRSGYIWAITGQEAVFGFKDDHTASFSRFELMVPFAAAQNLRDFQLLAADAAEGPYSSLGTFTARNKASATQYQSFRFSKVSARYLKLRLISNYGYDMHGWGNVQIYQVRVPAEP